MWKLLTGVIADGIYCHSEENDLLPVEQKGCPKNNRSRKDQLLIDKEEMKNCKRKRVGLSTVWIDC